jgi:hypothetical protein
MVSVAGDRIVHVAADVAEIAHGDVFQTLTSSVEVLVDLQGRFLHRGVCSLAAAVEDEILAARQPGVTIVVVEGQSEQGGGFALLIGGFHRAVSTGWPQGQAVGGLPGRASNAGCGQGQTAGKPAR